jgi:hypothetical protein
MAHTHRTAQKSIGHRPTGQLVPRNVPPQPELQHDSPHHIPLGEDSFEIVVTVPAGEDVQEAQHMPQNDDHDQQGEENNEEEEEEGNKAEGENYTPWRNTEKDETFHDVDEIKTFGDEAPIPTSRLRDLLNCINITTPPEFRIKRIPPLAEKSTRQSWRSSTDLLCSPDTRVQPSGPVTWMQ